MKKSAIHTIYITVRSIIVSAILAVVALYSSLYIYLSIPAAQNHLKRIGEKELSGILQTDVTIGKIEIDPLTRLAIFDVNIPDRQGGEMIHIDKLGAGLSLYQLIFERKIVFNYAELIGLRASIKRQSPDSPMNIQFVIDALKPKDKHKPPTKFDLALNAVIIRNSSISYDVLSAAASGKGRFDKNHILITKLNSDVRIPELRNDFFTFDIRRFSFAEKSGFLVSNFSSILHIDRHSLRLSNLSIRLPGTHLNPNDISLTFSDLGLIGKEFANIPLKLKIDENIVTLSDFKAFVPALDKLRMPLALSCDLDGTIDNINLKRLSIHTDSNWLSINTSAQIRNARKPELIDLRIPHIRLHASTDDLAEWIEDAGWLSARATGIISDTHYLAVDGSFGYHNRQAKYIGSINTGLGQLSTNGTLSIEKNASRFSGQLKSDKLQLGKIAGEELIVGDAAFDIETNMTFRNGKPDGTVTGNIGFIDLKGYTYKNISTDLKISPESYEGTLSLHDPNINLDIQGAALIKAADSKFDIRATLSETNLHNLNLTRKYPDHRLNVTVDAFFLGDSPDNAEGDIMISDISYLDSNGEGFFIDHFDITARKKGDKKYMTVNSDLANGYIDGHVNFNSLIPDINGILSVAFPSFQWATPKENSETEAGNDFDYYIRFAENDQLTSFFNLPATVVHPIVISGKVDAKSQRLTFGLEAPYIMQKKNIIEKTSIALNIDAQTKQCTLNAATQFDRKNGNILLLLNGSAFNDRIDTDLEWIYDRTKDFSGKVSLSSLLKKEPENGKVAAEIAINPSEFVVNDTIWNIEKSRILIADKKIRIDSVNVNREGQFIKANGVVSDSPSDTLDLHLGDIDLAYVFETLNINHVVFGGRATGDFHATSLLSKSPDINTQNLHVRQFSYHNALLGEVDIRSFWDNESKGIIINADIDQSNQRQSYVRGAVYLAKDSLAFKFDADHINVQILKPFMSAFTSDVEGEASGQAELYGTFKFINMKGRLFADRFRMRVDQTNTYYNVSDSIRIDPGLIRIDNATIRDDYGNTAKLDGQIRHTYFKNAEFDFAVTDVRNMLCFNTTDKDNPFWCGTIFGNGNAYINGRPGNVRIDVNMAAAPRSSFFFVLSDMKEAGEYTFVTFTDKRKERELAQKEKEKPEFLKKLESDISHNSGSTAFHINLLADVNPNVAITLIMDPDGGDRIRATGNGNMRIEYDSSDGMKMFGNYTAEEGRYNFTLQDIIIREFRIKQGATIAFHGDPLAASVDLSATYSVNANLQDLDESFAQDKDLNRTSVPVNALLHLSGIISQPEISFDLEFPTLTQDVYRKVRSIISTDDMMNQQIIYLLALNRFYTPEYMGNANRGNELASVASSTISSQLSNMLGQLSDNWTIAPNFHSDKGDFSDTEVELALSSHLLNNRLLLNGNFGYSDNAMNSNNFIGDFDIEYLLTKNGNFRLKAYNRYNDQNYYIRNALTTQGVGIMFKHDFDRLFRRKKRADKIEADTTSVSRHPADTSGTNHRKPIRRP